MNPSTSRSFLSPRAIQNARTRIFIPGSDPRFVSRTRVTASRGAPRQAGSRQPTAVPSPRLFSPGLLDRLHAPLTRYAD